MEFLMELPTVWVFFIVYFLRIIDVSLSVVRTIAVVKGQIVISVVIGFVEVSVWLVAVSQVITQIGHNPVLIIAYAAGFATGNAVGIRLEKVLAIGSVGVFMISENYNQHIVQKLRSSGFLVTTLQGEGLEGPKLVVYCVCPRKALRRMLKLVKSVDVSIFYAIGTVSEYSSIYAPGKDRAVL